MGIMGSLDWRLPLGAALASLSLLIVFHAPAYPFFVLEVGATEWGYLLAALALATGLPGWSASRSGKTGAALGAFAFLVSLAPLAQAWLVARDLSPELAAAFGEAKPSARPGAPARRAPLVLLDLLRGIAAPAVQESTVVYAKRGEEALGMDVYRPAASASAGPAPGVLVIHGGSWQGGDRGQLPALNRYLAARGYVVASADYRLAPLHPFPAAAEDMRAAVDYLKEHAKELGLDPTRLVLLGRSAGGQVALLAAYTAKDPAIRGVVAFYAPADLNLAYAVPGNPLVLDGRAVLRAFLGGTPSDVPALYDAASPIGFVGPSTPPTLLIHGNRDEMVWVKHDEVLSDRLQAAGRPHFFLRLPWATHGFDYNFNGPGGQLSTYAVERFLAAVTAPAAAPSGAPTGMAKALLRPEAR